MKTKLVLCSMLLGSWMALGAQQQPTAPGSAPQHTPPTLPRDEAQPPDHMPGSSAPDSSAPQGTPQGTPSAQGTTVEGCLSASNGNYSVTDSSGSVTQLQVPSSQISKLAPFEGKQVQVSGTPMAAGQSGAVSGSNAPGADTGSSSSRQGSKTLAATAIRLVAETCSNTKPMPK